MAVTPETRLLIWSRSGYRCAMCQRELFVDEVDTDDDPACRVGGDE